LEQRFEKTAKNQYCNSAVGFLQIIRPSPGNGSVSEGLDVRQTGKKGESIKYKVRKKEFLPIDNLSSAGYFFILTFSFFLYTLYLIYFQLLFL